MGEDKIRLLIVDDNAEICDILENFFQSEPDITVCGVAQDGESALFRIAQAQPDVVLLDLIMPGTDGISVLERLSQVDLIKRPHIIVTSAIGQEGFTSTALALGADYYMIKPCDLKALLSRVRLVASLSRPTPRREVRPTVPEESTPHAIARTIMELGIPAHMLGYQYCIAGVSFLLREGRPCSIVKELYATVANEFSTTPECVEGAIRKVIRRVWQENGTALATLLGTQEAGGTPPSNGRFLTTVSEHLRLTHNKKEVPYGTV